MVLVRKFCKIIAIPMILFINSTSTQFEKVRGWQCLGVVLGLVGTMATEGRLVIKFVVPRAVFC